MTNQEIINVLQDNAYIIKQHIALCNEPEKATPLRAYENTIKAIHDLRPDAQQIADARLLNGYEEAEGEPQRIQDNTAGSILVAYGLLNEKQVTHYKNYNFITRCNNFITEHGTELFTTVLARIKRKIDAGGKIYNMYAYVNDCLNKETENGGEGA